MKRISTILGLMALAVPMIMMVASCTAPTLFADNYYPDTKGDNIVQRPLDPALMSRKAVAYSGYRTGQSPDTGTYPSEAQIKQDLDLLVAAGFGLIRLYDTGTHGQRVLKVIRDHDIDLKVFMGVWIAGPKATKDEENQANVRKGIELATTYQDIVAAVSVGNETMVDWSFLKVPPLDMRDYIKQVRDAVAQPVGTNDNFEPFTFVNELGAPYGTAEELEQVARSVDFLALHTYALADPFYSEPHNIFTWDWRQKAVTEGPARATAMMDAALAYAKKNIRDARTALQERGIAVPIVIGETGWTDTGKFLDNGAHPVNQKMYYDRLQNWVYGTGTGAGKDADSPLAVFYFEAFDEPWKGDDDNWGLWTVNRTPKYVLSGTGYTESQAFYFKEGASVAETTYWLFGADKPASDVKERPTWTGWKWSAWENGLTASGTELATGNEAGTGLAFRIAPQPEDWGWGMAIAATQGTENNARENLSGHAHGHLRFKVLTTYPGKVEIGFRGTSGDVYLVVDPTANSFGYSNDGAWHEVAIPIQSILTGTGKTATELTGVADPFVFANAYGRTGNTPSSGGTNTITVDAIHWTKN